MQRILESLQKGNKQAPLMGTVVANERITSSDWEQDTRHIRITLKSMATSDPSESVAVASLPYEAGDIATVLPFNSDELVDRFLAVLPRRIQALADQPIDLEIDKNLMNNSFCHWPKRFTLRGWLKYCADIHALPEREDLRALSAFCSMEHALGRDQREKLQSLSEVSDAALYADYVLREKRSWADVIYDFESLSVESSELSVEALLTLLPPIRPRDFSIASAPSLDVTGGTDFVIELCVAVVKGRTRLGRRYHGLCSDFLSNMIPNDREGPPLLQLWIRPGSFGKLPLDMHADSATFQVPVICVGAGTGVAPMRSLLLARAARASASGKPMPTDEGSSSNILIFGCRKSSADFYYKDEWAQLFSQGHLRLLTAFSRDQFQKIYVQKVLREADDGALIARHLLERDGALYIAGGPKMARAVKEEVIEALAKELPGGEKEAKAFVRRLQRLGKLSIEAWS
jgi:sulfite reductase alpha subunit-like flavoprotein